MLGNLFRYEDDRLYKKRKGGNQWRCCNDLKILKCGYIRVQLVGMLMALHRLVYLFHNPEWDILDSGRDNQIDHINGNKIDNRIENLRVVNQSQNQQNTTHWGGKPIRGVSYQIGDNRWKAYWSENGKQKFKRFNTESEALAHRAKMVEILYTHAPTKRDWPHRYL